MAGKLDGSELSADEAVAARVQQRILEAHGHKGELRPGSNITDVFGTVEEAIAKISVMEVSRLSAVQQRHPIYALPLSLSLPPRLTKPCPLPR